MAAEGLPPGQVNRDEDARLAPMRMNLAVKILSAYYIALPFILIYLLFKIFPPNPWFPTGWRSVQMVFFVDQLNIWTTLDERLILLVVVAGLLGSYIHSATSYADFRGNREFEPSWLIWYLLRPFIGASLALVVYFALRGGLLSAVLSGTQPTDATQINPFGIGAISGLTGMFSKQAADKLAEVFSTLFRSQGDASRKDSLTAPAPQITSLDQKEGPAGGGTKVTITGTGFVADATVFFGANAATNINVVSDTTVTANTPVGDGVVDVTITNADGQKATASRAYTYLPGTNGDGGDAVETLDVHDVDLKTDTEDENLPLTEGGVE